MKFSDYIENKPNLPSFSKEQIEAIHLFDNFLNSENNSIFIFKGYAGTGKTTIIKYLIEYLVENKREPERIMAPTGRAAFVLQNKLNPQFKIEVSTIHRGIYNFDDIKEFHHSNDNKDDKSLTYKFKYDLNSTPDSPNRIFIIDEASMINKNLFHMIQKQAIKFKTKIIFI
jgi:ATP-dependent exoDNAse (exonuclease V) alpha subunit